VGWVVLPIVAALILSVSHAYLGLHILRRKVIFVDLALAQIAALGTTYAFLIGLDPASGAAYGFSLVFTVLGAAVFSVTRMESETIPQEAIIGIAYVVAGALAIVLVDAAKDPHGSEHIKKLLSGSIVWVTGTELWETGALYGVVAVVHGMLWRKFILVSEDPEAAAAQGLNIRLWDFLFYVTFGLVITASVRIAGVLLVFSYLVVPAVFAFLFAERFWRQLALGSAFAIAVSVVGILLSYDRPMGPAIVSVFGIALVVAGLGRFLWKAKDAATKLRTLGAVGLIALALVGLAAFGIARTAEGEREHDHHAHEKRSDHEQHAEDAPTPEPHDDEDLDALIDDAEEEAGH
jgi:zinc/manganese transport system permease protein